MDVGSAVFGDRREDRSEGAGEVLHGILKDRGGLVVVIGREAALFLDHLVAEFAVLAGTFGLVIEVLEDETFLIHLVHVLESRDNFGGATDVFEFAVFADVVEAVAGFRATDAEEGHEAPEVGDAVVAGLTREERNDHLASVGLVEIAKEETGVEGDAAEEHDELVNVIRGLVGEEEIGALLAIGAGIGLVDPGTERLDGSLTVEGADGIEFGDDGSGILLVDLDEFRGGGILFRDFDLGVEGRGHVAGVMASLEGEIGVEAGRGGRAVEEFLDPVVTHHEHALDVFEAVEVRGVEDLAFAVGDGLLDDRVGFEEGLEVRHLVEMLGDVDELAVRAGAVLDDVARVALGDVDELAVRFPVRGLVGGVVVRELVVRGDVVDREVQFALKLGPRRFEVAVFIDVAFRIGVGDADLLGVVAVELHVGRVATFVAGRHGDLDVFEGARGLDGGFRRVDGRFLARFRGLFGFFRGRGRARFAAGGEHHRTSGKREDVAEFFGFHELFVSPFISSIYRHNCSSLTKECQNRDILCYSLTPPTFTPAAKYFWIKG